MSNIEKIKAEIERLKDEYNEQVSARLISESLVSMGKVEALNKVLAFIDSLPEEDLYSEVGDTEEDYIKRSMAKVNECREMICKDSLQVSESCKENQDSFTNDLEKAAKEYVKDIPTFKDSCLMKAAFEDGWLCSKEKMLKDAVEGEKDTGWISVNDRLPETTEYVFTCVNQFGVPQCIGFHYYKDGKWWEGYEEDSVGAVEYWMPIPKFKEAKK